MNQGALGITLHPVADKLDYYFPAAEETKGQESPPPEQRRKQKNAGTAAYNTTVGVVSVWIEHKNLTLNETLLICWQTS